MCLGAMHGTRLGLSSKVLEGSKQPTCDPYSRANIPMVGLEGNKPEEMQALY